MAREPSNLKAALWMAGSIASFLVMSVAGRATTSLLAVFFLGERLTRPRLTAILLGLVGIVIIVRPGLTTIQPGHLIVLGAAVAFGISLVMVKSLTRTDNVVRIIFWMLIIQSVIGLVPAIYVWQNPPAGLWPWILLIAFTGSCSH